MKNAKHKIIVINTTTGEEKLVCKVMAMEHAERIRVLLQEDAKNTPLRYFILV